MPGLPQTPRGRGTAINPDNRFAPTRSEAYDDGWQQDVPPTRATEVRREIAKSVLTRNQSPDVGFDRSVNPYRGCEHGCIYCFARPSHAYWDLSPGIDFETKLIAKTNLAERLEAELSKPGYVPQPIALGVNTDAYQPLEREQRLTRQALEILLRYRHPVHIITKGSLVLRDLDLLVPLAEQRLVSVSVSLTTLDDELKRIMEPRAASPAARLRVLRTLHDLGYETDHPVMVVNWTNEEPGAPVAWRPQQRQPFRQPHARRRPVRRAAGAALPPGLPTPGLQPPRAEPRPGLQPFRPARPADESALTA